VHNATDKYDQKNMSFLMSINYMAVKLAYTADKQQRYVAELLK